MRSFGRMSGSPTSVSSGTRGTAIEALHDRELDAAVVALASDAESGLTEAEAEARLAVRGPNRLERPEGPSLARIAGRQFLDPLVGLLVAAAAVSLAIGEGVEAGVIAAIVVLNAALGSTQEAGAERAVLALRETVERRATVVGSSREKRGWSPP